MLFGKNFHLDTARVCTKTSEPCQLSAPEPPGTLSAIYAGPAGTSSAISAREFSKTSSAICAGILPNPPEPHQLPARKLFQTSSAICAATLRLTTYLPRNPPELHQPPALAEPHISHLHPNPPNLIRNWNSSEFPEPSAPETVVNPLDPSPKPDVAAVPDRAEAILGKKTHSKFCCWRKTIDLFFQRLDQWLLWLDLHQSLPNWPCSENTTSKRCWKCQKYIVPNPFETRWWTRWKKIIAFQLSVWRAYERAECAFLIFFEEAQQNPGSWKVTSMASGVGSTASTEIFHNKAH